MFGHESCIFHDVARYPCHVDLSCLYALVGAPRTNSIDDVLVDCHCHIYHGKWVLPGQLGSIFGHPHFSVCFVESKRELVAPSAPLAVVWGLLSLRLAA